MTNQLAFLDGSVGLDPDGPVDREAAGPEGAALGQLEPEALEPRGLGVGVPAVEGVARYEGGGGAVEEEELVHVERRPF